MIYGYKNLSFTVEYEYKIVCYFGVLFLWLEDFGNQTKEDLSIGILK